MEWIQQNIPFGNFVDSVLIIHDPKVGELSFRSEVENFVSYKQIIYPQYAIHVLTENDCRPFPSYCHTALRQLFGNSSGQDEDFDGLRLYADPRLTDWLKDMNAREKEITALLQDPKNAKRYLHEIVNEYDATREQLYRD
mmetsp:Transcript_11469/g.13155  ORF Transcript_11469/g.13155 Transcript_11469/m.13155 type:complete len:140 (-) Transcript_11469:651-1070(-)